MFRQNAKTIIIFSALGLSAAMDVFFGNTAHAEKIENPVAVFAALDKVTARISPLEVPVGGTAQFRALKITPRVCYSRRPTEPPQTTAFVEINEVKLNGEEQRIFTGWMFAESPGLHALEHAVFDVWLTSCKMVDGDAFAESPRKSDLNESAPSSRR